MKLDNKEMNLNLLQEECAELIQALSKIRRFDLDFVNPIDGVSNRDSLIQEMADVRLFLAAVREDYNITQGELWDAVKRKEIKLKTWYNKKSS